MFSALYDQLVLDIWLWILFSWLTWLEKYCLLNQCNLNEFNEIHTRPVQS